MTEVFPSDDVGTLEWQFPYVSHLFYFLKKVVFILSTVFASIMVLVPPKQSLTLKFVSIVHYSCQAW